MSLPYGRMLNVIYSYLVEHLGYDEKFPDRPRNNLDRSLDVKNWNVPGGRSYVVSSAPPWWHGDEDASQSFLAAVGVITT